MYTYTEYTNTRSTHNKSAIINAADVRYQKGNKMK